MIEAADKLRQSSDDLTHFARTYVVTGDERFKDRYFKTLDIRKFKHPDEEKLSLEYIFKSLPFTTEELAKLKLAKQNSDDLVNLEVKAFNAMKGFRNQALAISLMHSDGYYKAKHKIMNPIDDFIIMLNKRTNKNVEIIQNNIEINFQIFLVASLIFILTNIFIYRYLQKIETRKLENTHQLNIKLKEGEQKLKLLNESLEQKVEQRTKELQATNKKMQDSDQNGGEKGFPFGKTRFTNIIKEKHTESMEEQQNAFMMEMMQYESVVENNGRTDDITVIGFEIGA